MDYKVLLAYGYTEGKYGVNHSFSLEDSATEYDSDVIQNALAEELDIDPHSSDPGFEWDCLELELPENLVARIRADAIADYQKATGFEKEVTEVCPHCEAEVTLMWNTETDGYKAFCPHCGKRLMLCDACRHDGPDGKPTGTCNYCSETNSCKHNPAPATAEGPTQPSVYCVTTSVPLDTVRKVTKFLSASDPNEYQGGRNTISVTVVFPDGKQMDVKCCGCDDEASWTEAVLFDKEGHELSCTECSEDFLGVWELKYGDITYKAVVSPEEECRCVIVTKLNIFCQHCEHFFDADNEYSDLEHSVNNGYNCNHPDQEETETVSREDGGDDVKIGCCHATSCPLGYCPTNANLVDWGFLDEDDVEDGCMGFSNKDYIVVTDSKMVEKLVEQGFCPRILTD